MGCLKVMKEEGRPREMTRQNRIKAWVIMTRELINRRGFTSVFLRTVKAAPLSEPVYTHTVVIQALPWMLRWRYRWYRARGGLISSWVKGLKHPASTTVRSSCRRAMVQPAL
jgi:hypothetical protein